MATKTLIHHHSEDRQRIEVHQRDNLRWLEFGDGIIQSIIDVNNPAHLPSTVTRAMLACTLFIESPREILLLGTGGGALARHCHHCDPTIRGYAVDASAAVLQLARDYFDFPGPDTAWHSTVAEGQDYLAQDTQRYDVMIADIAAPMLTPDWLLEADTLLQCRRHLHEQGVLVMNLLCRDEDHLAASLWMLRRVFERQIVCLGVPQHRDIIVFAFNSPPPYRDRTELILRAKTLAARWQVELPEFLELMLRDNPAGSGVF